jgi:hypothetical protein
MPLYFFAQIIKIYVDIVKYKGYYIIETKETKVCTERGWENDRTGKGNQDRAGIA